MARILTAEEEYGSCGLVANIGDCGSLDEIEGLTPAGRERAFEFARIALNHLTAGVVANCPGTGAP